MHQEWVVRTGQRFVGPVRCENPKEVAQLSFVLVRGPRFRPCSPQLLSQLGIT
jgi:hypothetical protein